MRFREFGTTGIRASEVGFGVWTLATGWWGEHTDEDAVRLLRRAHELGITLFDTADTYGEGRGETLLRDAFGASDDVVVATKFGYDIYSPWERKGHVERPHDWTPTFVRYALERSLERLGRETIDVYQLHNPRLDALQSDELFALLEDFVREGKIRTYGAALGPAIGWRDEGVWALRNRDLGTLQIIHNALEQEPGREMLDVARERGGTGVMVRVPHSSGMLEGKYTKDTVFDENDHRRHRKQEWLVEGLQKIERLDFLTASGERTLGQAALKWLLADDLVTTTLPNIYGEEQLLEFVAAPDTPDLTAEEFELVERLYDDNFGLVAAGAPAE
jgi:aryl-alcohol dehydrogenase-like predicted oxidoreductase